MGLFSALFRGAAERKLKREERRIIHKGSEDELILFARRLSDQNQPERAMALLRKGEERFTSSEALTQEVEDIQEAIHRASIGAALAQLEEDSSPELRARLAELYRRVGDFPMAVKYGRQAIELDGQSAVGYRAVGRIYFEQFRLGQASIPGINALRHLSRAHSLDPRDSRILLNLAEIFVILRAPSAASKFLAPVQSAYPNDPHVVRCEERIRELPDEDTSQIQDLFLRYEQRQTGEQPHTALPLALPDGLADLVRQLAMGQEGTLGVFLIGANREIRCQYTSLDAVSTLGESIGVLVDTAHQNSQRMGIGHFGRLVATTPEYLVVTEAFGDDLTAFYLGAKGVKQEDVEGLLAQVRHKIGIETVEAA